MSEANIGSFWSRWCTSCPSLTPNKLLRTGAGSLRRLLEIRVTLAPMDEFSAPPYVTVRRSLWCWWGPKLNVKQRTMWIQKTTVGRSPSTCRWRIPMFDWYYLMSLGSSPISLVWISWIPISVAWCCILNRPKIHWFHHFGGSNPHSCWNMLKHVETCWNHATSSRTFRTQPPRFAGEARPIRQGRDRRRGRSSQRRPENAACGWDTLCDAFFQCLSIGQKWSKKGEL